MVQRFSTSAAVVCSLIGSLAVFRVPNDDHRVDSSSRYEVEVRLGRRKAWQQGMDGVLFRGQGRQRDGSHSEDSMQISVWPS